MHSHIESIEARRLRTLIFLNTGYLIILTIFLLVLLCFTGPIFFNVNQIAFDVQQMLNTVTPAQQDAIMSTIAAAEAPLEASTNLIDSVTDMIQRTNITDVNYLLGNVSSILSQIDISAILATANAYQEDIRVLTTVLNNSISSN